jgi:UDP-N-acetylmuramate dehydrogenase
MAMDTALKDALSRLVANPVQWDCPLSGYTSFAIGGPARALITVEDSRELQGLLSFFSENDLQWRVIGKGTNLLVRDSGFDGVIILLGKGFKGISCRDEKECTSVPVKAGGGCQLTRISGWCIKRGFSGLEFACGIPGTVGGAVVMNAGAWGNELANVLTSVTVLNAAGPEKIEREQMHFSYRCWQDHAGGMRGWIVTEVEMRLVRSDPDALRRRCAELIRKRRERQPKGQPNAGSFFKNPQGDSAGRLIDKSGCKGMRVGGAMVSPLHANFFVNMGGATAADVRELMDRVRKKVRKDCGVLLDPEVHFL